MRRISEKKQASLDEQSVRWARWHLDAGDVAQAVMVLSPLIDRSVPEALYAYGRILARDERHGPTRSMQLIERAANLGDPLAAAAMAEAYDDAADIGDLSDDAIGWYRVAAAGGHAMATMFLLAAKAA